MAEKGFGVKEIDFIGSSPKITSPSDLNLNAVNVAISTNVSIGGTLSVTGGVSIGGTLTYEDVTNIDSVGIITARSDIKVGTGVTITPAGGGFFAGILTATNIKAESNLTVAGGNLTLLNGDLYVNDKIIHYGDTDTSIQFDTDTLIFETDGSERIRVGSSGQLGVGGANYGSSGEVLTSNGSSSAPSWQTVSGGGGSGFFSQTTAGIHTLSKVGIGTTNPKFDLDLGSYVSQNVSIASTLRIVGNADSTAIRIGPGGASRDITVLRVDSRDGTTDGDNSTDLGHSIKYMGSGSGAENRLAFWVDNTSKSKYEALSIYNDGFVSVNYNLGFNGVSPADHFTVEGSSKFNTVRVVGVSTFQNVLPQTDSAYDIGSNSVRFANIYADTLYGSGANLTSLPSPDPSDTDVQVTFDIAGGAGSGYTFTGPGNDGTTGNPDIYLIRGQRYRFNNTTGSSHPFEFRNADNNADYTDGITGSQSGIQDFNVQYDAPAQLKYRCTIHTSSMLGNIYIVGAFPKISVSGQSDVVADNLADTLNLAAGSNVSITTNASTDTITISATDTTTNYYASSLSFNTSTGVLTVGRSGLTNLTVDLDGRYLDSSSSLSATNLTGTINNARLPTTINLSSGTIEARNIHTDTVSSGNLTSAGFSFYHPSGGFETLSLVKSASGYGTALFIHRLSTAGTGNLIEFQYNNGGVGNINTNGSTSTFNGGSDYRLKQDVENITDAITKIKSLRPVKFRWKNNLGVGYDSGFIAHEIQETGHYDNLVTGVKDGMREKIDDPNQQEPDYQGVDYGKFTPMLVAALKEISDKVDALDTRLTSLENT
tara:strand:+ start:3327 stop:5795 length:2469 start_codon:yes stop_codon:yes gene_type:complete